MSSPVGVKPCPFCGEQIKVNAVKCRFCGEFLDEEEQVPAPRVRPSTAPESGALKWLVPVGRSAWAVVSGYLAILAFVPLPIILWGLAVNSLKANTLANLMYLCAGINALFGLLAMVTGIVGLVAILRSEKLGVVRAIFGVLGGLLAMLLYPLITWWWVAELVKGR